MLVYLNGEISYSIVSIFLFSSNLCCVTHLEQKQFTFFHLLRFPLTFSYTFYKSSDIFFTLIRVKYPLIHVSSLNRLLLQAQNHKNYLKHMPTTCQRIRLICYASIDNSDEPVQMHSLIRTLAARTHLRSIVGSIVVSERT